MDAWIKSFGPGYFTYGAKFICFRPEGKKSDDTYVNLAQAPHGADDSPEWLLFAERVTDYLNELREIARELPTPTLDEIREYENDRKI